MSIARYSPLGWRRGRSVESGVMTVRATILGSAFGAAIVTFAALNPGLEVQFSAAFIEYRGNTLGLSLVLLTVLGVGVASRSFLGRIIRLNGGRRDRRS